MHRTALVLAVALPLAAADLIWKHVAVTPHWAYHPRGLGWLALSRCADRGRLCGSALRVAFRRLAAGVMVGGVLGNVLSAAWNDLRCPIRSSSLSQNSVIAFNLADVFTSTGILTLTGALAAATRP